MTSLRAGASSKSLLEVRLPNSTVTLCRRIHRIGADDARAANTKASVAKRPAVRKSNSAAHHALESNPDNGATTPTAIHSHGIASSRLTPNTDAISAKINLAIEI